MRIQFERSGGFAGIRFSATIDSDSLPPNDAQNLQKMVGEADFFSLPRTIQGSPGAVDSFQYKVTIESGGQRHTVETGDQGAPDSLRPLLRRLTVLARSAK